MYCNKKTALGILGLEEQKGFLTRLEFGEIQGEADECRETALLHEAFGQLKEYFVKKRQDFSLPLAPEGTVFQKKVWQALLDIPYGKTASYKDIAVAVGNPRAARAIGMANNRNPLAIFIPCHRVIGADGNLVGYGGGLEIKKFLLNLENGVHLACSGGTP